MIRTFTALAALPLALGLLGSFEDGAGLQQIATNISAVVEIDSGSAFDLGGGRTIEDAFESGAFRYDGGKF